MSIIEGIVIIIGILCLTFLGVCFIYKDYFRK